MGKRSKATSGNTALHADGLTLAQLNAVDALSAGKNDSETAALVGVHRVTVTKWRRYSLEFQAALNRKRADVWSCGIDRLRCLLPKAMDTLGELLTDGPPELRLKAAVEVAKLCPLSPHAFATGPTDPEDALQTEVMRRRNRVNQVHDAARMADMLGSPLPNLYAYREEVRGELLRMADSPEPLSEIPTKIDDGTATDIADPS